MADDAFVCVSEHTLLRSAFRSQMRVLDIGANHGRFRHELLQHVSDAEVHAIEANPRLVAGLATQGYASVTNCAVVGADREIELHMAENDEASSVLPLDDSTVVGATTVDTVVVEGRSMDGLLAEWSGFLDLVKVDIEGAEVESLLSLTPRTLRRIGQLSVEFHQHEMFGFGLEEPVRWATSYLRRQGFLVLSFDLAARDVLFVNRRHCEVTPLQALKWQWPLFAMRRSAAGRDLRGRLALRTRLRRITRRRS